MLGAVQMNSHIIAAINAFFKMNVLQSEAFIFHCFSNMINRNTMLVSCINFVDM